MANATNIYVKDYRDGDTYKDWTALSADAWTAVAGYGYNSQNWVTAIKFRVAAPASSVEFSWIAWNSEGGYRDLQYKITEGESSTYINATSSTAGDGTFTAESGQYFRTTLNVTKNLKANTDYVLYIWTNRTTAYNSFTTIRVWNASTYPLTVTYTAAASYKLSLSVGSNVSGTVTLNSSPFGRTGTVANNGTIYAGEVLKLTYSVSTGYAIDTHTLNGSTVSSGATHTVAAAVSIILTAKASLSTISTGNGTFGTAQTITVTRYNSSYTHTIKASCAGSSQTIATKSSSLSISWTPQNSFMNGIPSATSASCTLTCQTYNGNTLIGSTSITVTLSVPAGVKPAPSLSVSDSMGYASTYGGHVQGKSKAAVVVTDGNQYSATTASRSTTANGVTYSAASFTTGALTTSGSNSISTTVKDSRGRTGTASTSITVLAYSAPAISAFGVHRCDSDGTANDDGNYFKVTYTASVTSLNSHNSKTLKFRYRQVGGAWQAWQTISMSSYSQSGSSSAIDITTGVQNGASYDVEISLQDDFSTITRSTTLSTMPVTMDFNEYGDAVGFGKAPAFRKAVDIGSWDLFGRAMGMGRARSAITAADDLDTYTEYGVYGIETDANAAASNCPSSYAGTLRVWNAVGNNKSPGQTYQYTLQEYNDRYGNSWRRRGASGSGTAVTWQAWHEYGAFSIDGLISDHMQIANGSTDTVPIQNNEKGALVIVGYSGTAHEIVLFNANPSGTTVVFRQLRSANGLTITAVTNGLTIANSSGYAAYILRLSYVAS